MVALPPRSVPELLGRMADALASLTCATQSAGFTPVLGVPFAVHESGRHGLCCCVLPAIIFAHALLTPAMVASEDMRLHAGVTG
ncbi:hypothetical protein [Streptomyces sp. NPDC048577]|uniref:hypothetical protein n=1 Tax=Streptomyces sp. NPDC048577 TaxID=3157209 RepID=UPI0034493441